MWHQPRLPANGYPGSFETSRRREVLSFGHHTVCASLPPDEADKVLDWAETGPKAATQQRVSANRRRLLQDTGYKTGYKKPTPARKASKYRASSAQLAA